MKTLTLSDFGRILGITPGEFDPHTKALIESLDFRYRSITDNELNDLLLSILRKIDDDNQIVGAPERKQRWEAGWRENFDDFVSSGFMDEQLVPKFIRRGQPLRLDQNYIHGEDPDFELNFVRVLQSWIANYYFANCDEIHEFGCGTGFNLLAMAEIFPEKRFVGSDFVESSVELLGAIRKATKLGLTGRLFDMKTPDCSYITNGRAGIFTFGSLEQLAGDIDPMFKFLTTIKHDICLHVEPAAELYDTNNLADYLAYKFQSKRGYTSGLVGKLLALQSSGSIEIIKMKRLFFGSLFMEGYNVFVWRKRVY